MPEASARVLLDGTRVRVDGVASFALASRLLLTAHHQVDETMRRLARAGIRAVVTPPASPGTLATIDAILEAARTHEMLVVVEADPRVPNPSRFLGKHFAHHDSLHSYSLHCPSPGGAAGFDSYMRQRDALRTHDLFHPIWTPRPSSLALSRWLGAVDLAAVSQDLGVPWPRAAGDSALARAIAVREDPGWKAYPRPFIIDSLPVGESDATRLRGIHEEEGDAEGLPPRARDWFPHLADLAMLRRRESLCPDADLVRAGLYASMGACPRLVVADFHQQLEGEPPYSGLDRFWELSLASCELTPIAELLGEAEPHTGAVRASESGVDAAAVSRGESCVVFVWNRFGEAEVAAPRPISRVELVVEDLPVGTLHAVRLDYPAARPLTVVRGPSGEAKVDVGGIEIATAILITSDAALARSAAQGLADTLPLASFACVEGLDMRIAKAALFERELAACGSPTRCDSDLVECQQILADARAARGEGRLEEAILTAQSGTSLLRRAHLRHLTAAAHFAIPDGADARMELWRRAVATLPQFWRYTKKPVSAKPGQRGDEYT